MKSDCCAWKERLETSREKCDDTAATKEAVCRELCVTFHKSTLTLPTIESSEKRITDE